MSINFIATTKLIHALNDSEYTAVELIEITGFGNTIYRWIRKLHDLKLIYIIDWKRSGKIWAPVYTWGFEKEDKPKPKAMTQAEYNARAKRKKQLALLQAAGIRINERLNR